VLVAALVMWVRNLRSEPTPASLPALVEAA
jgi:hypothetical protein